PHPLLPVCSDPRTRYPPRSSKATRRAQEALRWTAAGRGAGELAAGRGPGGALGVRDGAGAARRRRRLSRRLTGVVSQGGAEAGAECVEGGRRRHLTPHAALLREPAGQTCRAGRTFGPCGGVGGGAAVAAEPDPAGSGGLGGAAE